MHTAKIVSIPCLFCLLICWVASIVSPKPLREKPLRKKPAVSRYQRSRCLQKAGELALTRLGGTVASCLDFVGAAGQLCAFEVPVPRDCPPPTLPPRGCGISFLFAPVTFFSRTALKRTPSTARVRRSRLICHSTSGRVRTDSHSITCMPVRAMRIVCLLASLIARCT